VPNDLPDWYVSQTPNVNMSAAGILGGTVGQQTVMATITPSQYLIYGWALSGVIRGTSLGADTGVLQLILKDGAAHTILVAEIAIATAIPSNGAMVYASPIRPPGLNASGSWQIILYTNTFVSTSTYVGSYVLLYA
jgi:hypothetical protein